MLSADADAWETTGLLLGRATAAARVDFFELVVRFREVFFDDFPAADFFPEAGLFLVTFVPMSFRLDDVFPDCACLLRVFTFAEGLFEVALLEAALFFGIR